MKTCPNCRRTYDDDGLNFCLDDGSVLTFAASDAAPTVVMDYPRPTSPRGDRPTLDTQDQAAYSMQPKKKSSKTWVWVLGIFAILVLVCGGGMVGAFLYVASIANTNTNVTKGTTNSSTNKGNTFTRSATPVDDPGEATEVDLSGWVEEPQVGLDSEYVGGEFFMTTKQKGYYFVLVAKNSKFSASKAARVVVRNPDDSSADLGYGLVFNSDTTPLSNDYAFLIDTVKKKYRVVRHQNDEEKTITDWTSSNLIKAGGEPNILEARNSSDKIDLFINGQRATSVANKQGPKSGVPGLYVGEGAKIGFSKLEIVK